jgi:hypothetical protein
VKKYHSLAAKGEQVDISELTENEQKDSNNTEPMIANEEPSPPNGVASHHQNIEQPPPQTTTGAQSAKHSSAPNPSPPTAQAAPVTMPNPPVVGAAMPQALLNTGNANPNHN